MKVADAVVPVPPFVEVTAPVTLLKTPPSAAATVVETVQLLFPAKVPPARLRLPPRDPPVAVPPQVLVVPGNNVLPMPPEGYVSVKATPLSAVEFGLVMVMVSVELPRDEIGLGEKDSAMSGGASTVRLAELLTGPVLPH